MEKNWWPQPGDAPAELAEPALTFLDFIEALESLGLEFIDSTHAERFGHAQGSKRRTLLQWLHALRYDSGELEPGNAAPIAGEGEGAHDFDLAELGADAGAGDDDEPTDSNGDEPAELEPSDDGAAAGADKRATARSHHKKKGKR